jgi:hypothetical protein
LPVTIKRPTDRAHGVGHGRQRDWHAFQSVALGLPVQGLMLAELLEHDHGQGARAGHPRAMGWNGAGAWLIFSQSRQLNFSRTVSIISQWRGITSSVRVTSSPSLRRRLLPQHSQAVGGSITTRSRARCSGNVWRSPRLRVNPRTVVVLATACSAASSSSVASAFSPSKVSAN